MGDQKSLTLLLQDLTDGKIKSDELMPQIYRELHVLARVQRRRFAPGETLNTTALVHEAYLKLVDHSHQTWEARSHFFSVAAKAMRSILVDYAKMQKAAKRGGNKRPVTYQDHLISSDEQAEEVLYLDEALTQLEKVARRQSKVVELRFFCGFTIEETADLMSVSPATVKRDWNLARSWLYREIRKAKK